MASTSVTLRIPNELLALIDAEAERRGMKRTAAIVNGMWSVTPNPKIGHLVPLADCKVIPKTKAARAKNVNAAVDEAKTRVVGKVKTGNVGGYQPLPIVVHTGRPDHDVKECRVYRCGACAAAKG